MLGIMADNDVAGEFEELLHILRSTTWCELWDSLQLKIETFESLGFARDVKDVEVW